MTITLAPPIKAKKEPICRGDEATVSRIMSGRYKGMVERLQDSSKCCFPDGMPFQMLQVAVGPESESLLDIHSVPNTSIMYPVFQFLSLRAAGLLFPGNFVFPRHLRLSVSPSGITSEMYSDFVSDDSGRILRTEGYRQLFYGPDCSSRAEKLAVLMEADEAERNLCPALVPLVEAVQGAGITPAHPEANYQLSRGNIVLFEIQKLDLVAAVDYISEKTADNPPARELLALIHMVALKEFAIALFRACPYMTDVGKWARAPLPELMKVYSSNYGRKGTSENDRLFGEGIEIVKGSIEYLPQAYSQARPPYPGLPLQVDERFFELI
jgi:hypothetical protein